MSEPDTSQPHRALEHVGTNRQLRNKCLLNALEFPLGCYEEERHREHGGAAWDRMMEEVMAYYQDEVPGAVEASA